MTADAPQGEGEIDREIRTIEEAIARLTKRLDDLKRRKMALRATSSSSSGTIPSMRAVREDTVPSSRRRKPR